MLTVANFRISAFFWNLPHDQIIPLDLLSYMVLDGTSAISQSHDESIQTWPRGICCFLSFPCRWYMELPSKGVTGDPRIVPHKGLRADIIFTSYTETPKNPFCTLWWTHYHNFKPFPSLSYFSSASIPFQNTGNREYISFYVSV